MTRRTHRGALTAALLASGLFLVGTGVGTAQASPSCPAGSTEVATGICEIRFTNASTPTSFTPPAGITFLEALLVGAGGTGGWDSNGDVRGGGGGEVRVVSLGTTGDVTIVVGARGDCIEGQCSDSTASSVTQASLTETAQPGALASSGGASGAGYAGAYGGGGAGGAANGYNGGAGVIVQSLVAQRSSMFLDDTDCYGGGGAIALHNHTTSVTHMGSGVCGGAHPASSFIWPTGYLSFGALDGLVVPVTANSGGGGMTYSAQDYPVPDPNPNYYPSGMSSYSFGANGLVALRFTWADSLPSPTLPDGDTLAETGAEPIAGSAVAAGTVVLGSALVLLGAARARRRRA